MSDAGYFHLSLRDGRDRLNFDMPELQPLDSNRSAISADLTQVRSSRAAWIGVGLMAAAGVLLIYLFPGSAEQDTD